MYIYIHRRTRFRTTLLQRGRIDFFFFAFFRMINSTCIERLAVPFFCILYKQKRFTGTGFFFLSSVTFFSKNADQVLFVIFFSLLNKIHANVEMGGFSKRNFSLFFLRDFRRVDASKRERKDRIVYI